MGVDYTARFMFGIELDYIPESLKDEDGFIDEKYTDSWSNLGDAIIVLEENGYDSDKWFVTLNGCYLRADLGRTTIVNPESLVVTQEMIHKVKTWLVDHDIEVTEPRWMLSCYQW